VASGEKGSRAGNQAPLLIQEGLSVSEAGGYRKVGAAFRIAAASVITARPQNTSLRDRRSQGVGVCARRREARLRCKLLTGIRNRRARPPVPSRDRSRAAASLPAIGPAIFELKAANIQTESVCATSTINNRLGKTAQLTIEISPGAFFFAPIICSGRSPRQHRRHHTQAAEELPQGLAA